MLSVGIFSGIVVLVITVITRIQKTVSVKCHCGAL